MTQEAHFFRVGLFVLGTLALGAAGIIWLGATNFFEPSALVETCFDESVQGLEVGAPVKFRGIEIGSVVAIESADALYRSQLSESEQDEFGRYIIVTMRITAPQFFEETTSRLEQERIDTAVERGFRVRQNLLGLSGAAFINADFVDPELFPPLEISWRPRYSYVPSAPSSLPRIVESASQFFGTLGSSELVSNLDRLMITLDEHLQRSDVPRLVEAASAAAESFAATSRELKRLLDNPDLQQFPADLAATSGAVRSLTSELERDLPAMLADLRTIVERTQALLESEELGTILASTATLATDLQLVTKELPVLLGELQRVLRRIDRVAAGAEGGVDGIAVDLQRIVRHLERLTADIKANPSQSIFGNPPPGGSQ